MQQARAHHSGFTLLEMTIVLIIVAVLIAAVTYAKTLIVTSHLQQVITDVDSYTSAVSNFKQQYNALPGISRLPGRYGAMSAAVRVAPPRRTPPRAPARRPVTAMATA